MGVRPVLRCVSRSTVQYSTVQHCKWLWSFTEETGINMLDMAYFGDEAWFHLERYINRLPRRKNPCAHYIKSPYMYKKN